MTRFREKSLPDGGFTITEMVVAMSIFMVLLSLFAATMANFASTTSRTVQISDQATDARTVYNLFDRSVRSASAVNRPQLSGRNWYVEYLTTATTPNLCTQWVLRLDTHTLALRTWVPVPSGTTTPSSWRTVATDVSNTSGQQPFGFTAATVSTPVQRLGINLYFRRGSGAATPGSSTFVALNSSVSSASNQDANSDGVSDTEVCTGITDRRPA